MLTFMNSKLTKMTGKDKQNHIFQKGEPYEISGTDIFIFISMYLIYIYIYIYIGEDREFIWYFTGVSH